MSLRILIIGPSWIGDMVMAQSLFKALKQKHPDSHIDVLAPDWSLPLLQRMPEVRQGISMPLLHGQLGLAKRWCLGKRLRGQYDWSIVLPNAWKSALVPLVARIAKRTGWLGEQRYGLLNDWRRLDNKRLTMTVQRFVALADAVEDNSPPQIISPQLSIDQSAVQQALRKHGLQKNTRRLVLCPGAEYGPAKQWPAAYYAELARDYLAQGWQVWLFGSEKDRAICAGINRQCADQCNNLSGKTSLAEAIDLMSLADAVVSNDSGLMHVAAALNRPLVGIYGSSDPNFTPPLNERHRIVSLGLACSPCFKRECPLGHLDCLKKITVDKVKFELNSHIYPAQMNFPPRCTHLVHALASAVCVAPPRHTADYDSSARLDSEPQSRTSFTRKLTCDGYTNQKLIDGFRRKQSRWN